MRAWAWARVVGAGMGLGVLGLGAQPVGAQQVDMREVGYTRGDPRAPLVIIEFGDFGCSACAVFARNSWPVIEKEFIATGKVYWRYVPFLLGHFRHGEKAARASECAGEQDAFFAMHDRLYEEQRSWSGSASPDIIFSAYATALKLDSRKFEACYAGRRSDARTLRNGEVATLLGVRATPTFFVNGMRIQGAVPPDVFREFLARLGAR